jgi:hypothetical protein
MAVPALVAASGRLIWPFKQFWQRVGFHIWHYNLLSTVQDLAARLTPAAKAAIKGVYLSDQLDAPDLAFESL